MTPPSHVVRFIAIGDVGEGKLAQYDVGAAFDMVCQVQACDFELMLGDNFYDDGVSAIDDPQLHTKFEAPRAAVQLPF